MIPDRLMDSTVHVALGYASKTAAAATARSAVASLADRVLKIMLVARLSLLFAPVLAAGAAATIVLGLFTLAAGSPPAQSIKPGVDDLRGRVVDKAGAAVPDAEVCGVVGSWGDRRRVATTKTDGQGRFVLGRVWDQRAVKSAIAVGNFSLSARASDGRLGWLALDCARWLRRQRENNRDHHRARRAGPRQGYRPDWPADRRRRRFAPHA